MAEYDNRERFIPFRKSEMVGFLCKEETLGPEDREIFRTFCNMMASIYHYEFHKKSELLKENYHPFNPDTDTRSFCHYSPEYIRKCEDNLLENLKKILTHANYREITEKDLRYAIEKESLFKISLFVDFDDFDRQLIFCRGAGSEKRTVKKWGIRKTETDIPIFERVALLIKFKDAAYFESKKRKNLQFEPGSMIIKLFKNVPRADMEMLFPNTQVRMKLKDKLLMGGSAVAGGVAVLLKAGAGLIAMASVLWFMLNAFLVSGGRMPATESAEVSAMVGGISALGVIGAFILKQWNSYKNRKIRFMKTLGDNLYFKNLDNNAGVFHHLTDAAEEEECKEAMLGYYFLLRSQKGLSESALDDIIEDWFEKEHHILIDFEIKDALQKLEKLKLCRVVRQNESGKDVYQAVSLNDACKTLDDIWDNYFRFNI